MTNFKYLGAIISNEGSKPEILSRIAQTTATLSRLKIIWRDKNISLASKVKLMRMLILSTVTKLIKSCLLQCFGTFKMPILMFISILVFRPEGQIWNPVRRDTRIYVRRILNASRISKTQLSSCTISPS